MFEKKDPLTHREALVILERIFDIIMELDKLKEDQPAPDDELEVIHWYVPGAQRLGHCLPTFSSGKQTILPL